MTRVKNPNWQEGYKHRRRRRSEDLNSGPPGYKSAIITRPVSTWANSAVRSSDGLSGHTQLEIQAESDRLLANARSVLEVESSLTFSRPE